MIEDPELTEFRLKPIDPKTVVSAENGEKAYALQTISHGKFKFTRDALAKLAEIVPSSSTLGFEIDTECDFDPYALTTYNADKSENARYDYGEHFPGEKNYIAPCRFRSGEKVLCLMFEGYDAVFPAIVVGPLTREYLEEYYKTCDDLSVTAQTCEEFIESWSDWNWDSVIVRPLVRLRNDWEEMGETVVVNRVYLFPYQQFDL